MFVGWEGVRLCSYLLIGFYAACSTRSGVVRDIVARPSSRASAFAFMLGVLFLLFRFGRPTFQP
jgi:NADH:ubiquinone oxidoreductase subunit 5 (subunit L)/multisubunit Na+/H+ antiporter MnhA subunit